MPPIVGVLIGREMMIGIDRKAADSSTAAHSPHIWSGYRQMMLTSVGVFSADEDDICDEYQWQMIVPTCICT